MGYLKRGCAMALAFTMVLGLLPGMDAKAADAGETSLAVEDASTNGFDAYRAPFLSGPVQTWVYQGEEFDYENSRNQIFADDQEDGDLTKNIIQKGSVDTSGLGDQEVIYEVTDSDGNKSMLKTTVTVLAKDSADESARKIQRKLYTLPDASHLSNIGFNRGYYHDRQNLGFWVPAGETLTARLVNHEEFSADLNLRLLNNDAYTEMLVQVSESGEIQGDAKSGVNLPKDGSWITVKNWCQTQDAAGNKTDGWRSVDSVPFITTPKNTPVQPVIEIKWNDAFQSVPYYRYGDDEESFFASWDRTKDPYAIIEGDSATFLVPVKDRNNIIDRPNTRTEYQFHTIDEMLEWYAAFVKQYDAYAGLDFYTDQPYSQNVRAKFFIKANKHGAGAAYYGGEESATNGDSMAAYLAKEWTSLHEFGHGYEGAIASQENSFVETTNNIMGYYFEMTYRPEDDLGWLLGGKGSTYLEAYNEIGRQAERARQSATVFNDMTEGAKQYDKTLFMFVNLLDRLGPEKGTSAMHTDVRKYHYEHNENRRSSDTLVDVFSHEGGYNVIPYFDGWHIYPSKVLENHIYDSDLPMLYYLRDLVPDDAEAERARAALAKKGLSMNGIYSLVSTDDLAGFGYTSNVKLKISIDNLSKIQGKKIQIKNGEKVAAEVTVEAEKTEYSIELPAGIYEVELPTPRTADYKYNNEYLVAYKTNSGAVVEKNLVYSKVAGNPLVDDAQVRLLGMSDCEVFAFTLITGDDGQHQLNYRLNNVEPHMYFSDQTYITVDVQDPNGASLWNKSVNGTGKPDAVNEICNFPNGSKLVVTHKEIGRMRFTSQYTKKVIPDYAVSGGETVTFVMTDKGLKPEGWDQETLDSAYFSMLKSYSEYLMENMTLDDLEVESRFHNSKMVLSKAYECLSDAEKEEYDKEYGRLIGHEQTVYGYEKIDPSLLTATAASQQGGQPANNAVNAEENNGWHTQYSYDCIGNGKNHYTITLSQPKDVYKLEYVPLQDNGRILTYKIAYSAQETGDDNFTDVTPKDNGWSNDNNVKSALFEAPGARRIRITALTTGGDPANNFVSAKKFYLYERYEEKTTDSYLCDVNLGSAWDGDPAVAMDKNSKTITMTDARMTADLIGKEFDTLAGKVSVSGNTAVFKIYDGEGEDAKLLYRFEASSGDTEEMFSIDIAGIRKLRIEAGGEVTLSRAKFGNHEDKENIFLVTGDQATAVSNTSLVVSGNGRMTWTSENDEIATVNEYGVITAVAAGETAVTGQASGGSKPVTCNVYVTNGLEGIIQAIDAVKAEKKAELEKYKDADDYDAAGKEELAETIASGKAAIDAAMNLSGIQAALDAAKKALDQIKSGADVAEQELKRIKEEAKRELEDYKDSAVYRKAQRQELKRAIAEGKLLIDEAANADAVVSALEQAKALQDAVKTDLQMAREELRELIAEVTERMKNLNAGDYSQAVWTRLQDGLENARRVLDNQDTDAQEITAAYQELASAEHALRKPLPVKDAEDALQALIDEYASLAQDDYQEASWAEYQVALAEAKTYLPGGANEQFEDAAPVLAAAEALTSAKEAMEPKMLVLEGDWVKELRSSDSGLQVADGKLVLSGAGSGNSPATFASSETFDFSKSGSFEFDLEGYDGDRFGIYLDYQENENFACGMYFGMEGTRWYWQRFFSANADNTYGNSGTWSDKNQKHHIKVTWTADGKFSLFVDGQMTLEDQEGTGSNRAEGKIAFACVSGATATLSDIRPLKTKMRIDPIDMTAITAKDPIRLNARFRSAADKNAKAVWQSSDENTAYVDGVGNIWFTGTGEAELTATASLADGTEATAVATARLPERIGGSKGADDSYEEADSVVKGVWANTEASVFYNDGPASFAVDGRPDYQWHSEYRNNQPVHPTSDEDPVKLTIEFAYDLSLCQEIKFLQADQNGRVNKYKLVTGDRYDQESYEILDSAASGIQKTETDPVEDPDDTEGWVTLQLPNSTDADGWLGHYLQIQVLSGHNNYAAIKEITAHFEKEIKDNETEQAYMAANRQLLAAIKGLKGVIGEAEGAKRKDYLETDWNALQDAIADAKEALADGADKGTLDGKKEALQKALANTTIQYTVTFDWNYAGRTKEQYVIENGHATALTQADAPNRTGYEFTGKWYTDPACEHEYDFAATAVTGDITLYAGWFKNAEPDPNPELTQAKEELEESLARAEDLARADYSENGWAALQAAIEEAREALNSDTKDTVTKAKEKLDGAIAHTKAAETAEEKDKLQKLYDHYLRDYDEDLYTEDTWAEFQSALDEVKLVLEKGDAATLEEIVSANNRLEQAKENLDARPDIIVWTVTFDWNYEGAQTETRIVGDGGHITALTREDAPNRTGYEFTEKWYTDPGCSNEYRFSEETVESDFTLYAGWKLNSGGSEDEDNKDDEDDKNKTEIAAKEEAKKAVATAQESAKAVVAAGKGDYTTESWNAFLSAYNAIKNLTEAQKNKMTAVELKKLADNLKKAQTALKKEAITSLKFASKTYQIANGKSVNLKKELTILPEGAANQKLVWTMSGSAKYAKLNSGTGVVKALKKGIKKSVTITVTTEDGKVSAKTTVKVMKGRVSKVAAKGSKKVKVKAGKSVTLKTNVKTTGGKPVNKALKWTSSNTKVATVKGSGKLAANAKVKIAKGVTKGKKATITAVSTDGTNKKLKFTITVK